MDTVMFEQMGNTGNSIIGAQVGSKRGFHKRQIRVRSLDSILPRGLKVCRESSHEPVELAPASSSLRLSRRMVSDTLPPCPHFYRSSCSRWMCRASSAKSSTGSEGSFAAARSRRYTLRYGGVCG